MCSTIKQRVLAFNASHEGIPSRFLLHRELKKFYSCFLYSFLVGSVVDG